jgi:hypothetical protein
MRFLYSTSFKLCYNKHYNTQQQVAAQSRMTVCENTHGTQQLALHALFVQHVLENAL